ncbi:MAG: hypothetical protein JNK60_00505, partial [Acidobacteria bacterium]|nr:hypothetical protein [Acidobacteriota bacterium]
MSRRAAALLALALTSWPVRALDPARRPDLYTQEVWLAGQALPAGRLRTIYQSFDGYLWIGSYDGLVRFDGTRFVSFGKHELPSLRSNVVNVILEDRQGVLWIGTQAGLTRLFRDGTAATLGTEDGLPHPRVNALVEDPEGGLWVGTEGGLLKLRAGRPTVYGAADGLPSAAVLALASAPDGTVWIGTRSGLVSFREGRFTSYGPKDGLLGDQVTALYVDRDGSLLMGHGTVEGYTVLKDGVFSTRTVKDGLPHGTIELFLRDRDGNLWLGSWTGGLSRVFEGRVDVFGQANAPLDDGVVSILEDREGSLWVATVGGLVRLHDGRFTVWSRRNGLVSDTVRSIWTDADGTVWLGGTPGLHRIRDGRLEVLKGPEGDNRMLFRDGRAVRTDRLRQTGGSARGTLWLGTGRGLFRGMETGKSFSFEEVLGGYVVDSMVEEPDGTYLIGTNGAGLLR